MQNSVDPKNKRAEAEKNKDATVEERSYYYDDSHGYEDYDKERDEEDDEFDD